MTPLDIFSAHRHERDALATLERRRVALLVVDMLNDFCEDGGAMVLPDADVLYPPINALCAAVREAGGHVVWVCDRHQTLDDAEFAKRTPHCLAGTWGAGVVAALDRREGDLELVKRRYSAFFQTDLDLWLRERAVSHVVVAGVVTNICVRSTVHDAFFRGYEVIVPEDACAATGPREQESSLYDIETHFGTVTSSQAVCAALRSLEAAVSPG